jgi:hypothetical protein
MSYLHIGWCAEILVKNNIIFSLKKKEQGLILTTKNPDFYSVFWLICFLQIPTDFFTLYCYKKFTEKLQKSCHLAAAKNMCRFFFHFTVKI